MSEVIAASPNEEHAARLEEFRRARLQRLLQVRDVERQRAKTIRSAAEEQAALARGQLKQQVNREVSLEFKRAMQSTRQRLRSAETSVGESFAAAQQHQEVLAVEARADYEALSRSVRVAAQRHQAAVHVEAAISSESPGAVARQRAQRMLSARQDAAQESVSWASSRPPAQPRVNESPKPAPTRRQKPVDASAFHTSHHHIGAGLLYPHSAPNVQVLRHPRSSADISEVPALSVEESTLTASAPSNVSSRHVTPDVGRRALANKHNVANNSKNTSVVRNDEPKVFSRVWPQPRGISPHETEDDVPNPLPTPQPRTVHNFTSESSADVVSSASAVNSHGALANSSSDRQVPFVHASHPNISTGPNASSLESSPAPNTASRASAAPAALPLNLVSHDGRLTMSATDIAQRIAELHRVRAIQEEAKQLKQEATIISRGRDAAAYLRERSEAASASAAVEQLIKQTEQVRRNAARGIAPFQGPASSGSVPENIREKAFERLLFQSAPRKELVSAASRIPESDSGMHSRLSGKDSSAADTVAQPLPSSLSLRGAILRESGVSSSANHAVVRDSPPESPNNPPDFPMRSPSKQSVTFAVPKPLPYDSDSSSDSLEVPQHRQQQNQTHSSSDSDDIWPPSSHDTQQSLFAKRSNLNGSAVAPVAQSSREGTSANLDSVLMSDSSSSSSPPTSPIISSRSSNPEFLPPQKGIAAFRPQQMYPSTSPQRSSQDHSIVTSEPVMPSLQRSESPSEASNMLLSGTSEAKPPHEQVEDEKIRMSALLSPSSRSAKIQSAVAPLRSSAPASIALSSSTLRPEHSTSVPSPTRIPVSPAHARVRVLMPTIPLSPEPAAVIRSPPSSNISTPSDLQSPSLFQRANVSRDLHSISSKSNTFFQPNSSFGEAASLAAMDDYNVRHSVDDKLDTRLSVDTWMRLSAARSSIASLEHDFQEQDFVDSSSLSSQKNQAPTVSASDSSDDDADFHESIANAGNSATDAVRNAIERISNTVYENTNEFREPKTTTRVAWDLPPRNLVLPSNQGAFSASDASSSTMQSADPSYLDPSFWLTSFGAQVNEVLSADSVESDSIIENSSALHQSPKAARKSQSSRSTVSTSSASASNSSIRDAIESYRKATMFVMPAEISSDSSECDSSGFASHQNVAISSDSESEQSDHVDSTVDYLNRRVRIERDQLLQTAQSRARSSQSTSHQHNEQPSSQRSSSKPQSHRRVVFADSPSSKALNPRIVPHELKYVHIVAETQRRWNNLPEVQRQMHAQETAKSLEASRQKAKLDAEIFRLSLLAKQSMRKPRASTPPSRPFKP